VEDEDNQHSIAYCIYLLTSMKNSVRQSNGALEHFMSF